MIIKKGERIIADNAVYCTSLFSKALGLMFRKFRPLVFYFKKEQKTLLHMLFVFYPIDVVYLDNNGYVVETIENFKPFSLYFPKNKAKFILELQKGTISGYNINLKDKIYLLKT